MKVAHILGLLHIEPVGHFQVLRTRYKVPCDEQTAFLTLMTIYEP